MNTQWALDRMREYRSLLSQLMPDNLPMKTYREVGAMLDVRLTTVQEIARAAGLNVGPSLWAKPATSGTRFPQAAINACDMIIGELESRDERARNLAPTAPQLSADSLHPWIWSQAASLWNTGHRREAVQAAATLINAETQTRVGRRDVFDSDLMNQVFSKNDPEPGKPRLRWPGDQNDARVQSMNNGLRGYAAGVFQTIRNAATHELNDIPEQVALEQLAALSLLARWIEACQLVTS